MRLSQPSWIWVVLLLGAACSTPAWGENRDVRRLELVVASKAPLPEGVVVALTPQFSLPPSPPPRVEIEQRDAQFQPFISVAQRGATVEFPNRDGFAHHVYSFSKAMAFELPLYAGGQVHEVIAHNTGVVPLGCNIHDWMLGYIYVVDTPFHGRLTDGQVVFDHLPAGEYEASVWYPSLRKPWHTQVAISPAQQRLKITLPHQPRRVAQRSAPRSAGVEDY